MLPVNWPDRARQPKKITPLTAAQLDAVLARAERAGLSHLEFVHALIAEQAQ